MAVPEPAPPRPPRLAEPPSVKPLDPPMVPFALAGLAAWLLAGLILLSFRSELIASGREHWLTICGTGFLLGLPGLALMVVHDRNRKRRRSLG